nr:hypothetical protein [Acidobacteriota bacterium]
MKKLTLAAMLALILAANFWAQNPARQPAVVGAVPASEKNESSSEIWRRTFDIVWQTVRDKHFDPTLGGVDWEKIRQQYQPQVSGVKSDAELYRLLQQMLGELHQSHFNIIPPEAVIADNVAEPPTGGIGADLRMIDGATIITRVEPGSAAESSGML